MEYRALFDELKKGELRRVYLFHGEEEYAKDRALEALIATTDEATRDFNVSPLTNPDVDAIIAACELLPLMAEHRVVIVRECRFFSSADEAKPLIDYLPAIAPTTTLVFFERLKESDSSPAEQRKSLSTKALYKAVEATGGLVWFSQWSDDTVERFAVSEAKKRGTTLPVSEAQLLVFMTGKRLSDVASETAKVSDYAGEGAVITREMIETCVRKTMEYDVFRMLECFLAGKTGEGFSLLAESLRNEGSGAAVMLLMFFSGRIRLMLDARRHLDAGASAQKAAQNLGGNPYAAQMSVKAAQRFSTRELQDAVLALSDADYAIKSGGMKDTLALETALARIFVKPKKKAANG